ncbi:Octopine transport system permease protein OccM [bioreactor metagenome]|uniref:Octopine transport system permease protein OccM n=2 Tax=root TaxID=1 RepID=A0A645FEN2_9ZZZZ
MTRRQAIWNIILPQALRRAIPGCSNEMIYLIKYSSLAYMLTYIELTGAGKIVAARSFRYTLVFTVVGIMYLIMVSFASWLLSLLEKKLYIPGWSQHR